MQYAGTGVQSPAFYDYVTICSCSLCYSLDFLCFIACVVSGFSATSLLCMPGVGKLIRVLEYWWVRENLILDHLVLVENESIY